MADKSIVIYYSRDGENYLNGQIVDLDVGNTEVIAEYIREFTGADLFKVETVVDYPSDYMETTEVAKKEQKNNERPEIRDALQSIDDYDTVYIGCPNWWGTLPMCMFTQLEALDFKDKRVKFFITHEGSGIGQSMKDIKKLCNGADIADALAIHGSTVKDAKNQVERWIKE